MTKKSKGYSIIIPAYQSESFIEECLTSIQEQTHFKKHLNYEILLGIDACPHTLKKVKDIMHQYKHLRVFNFPQNGGPYVTKNSLIPLTKYDYLLFFDSDDQMKPFMVTEIDKKMSQGYDVCRFKYLKYKDGMKPSSGEIFHRISEGSTCHTKEVHEVLGGFETWPCSADSDFRFKCDGIFDVVDIETPLFFRRVHPNSLTQGKEYGLRTSKRQTYLGKVKKRISNGYYKKPLKVEIEVAEYEELSNENNG